MHENSLEVSDRLITLGKIIASDVFLNNPDRIPALFENHKGNAGNIMIEFKVDYKCDEDGYHD